jgi:hypothetical protein
LLEGEQLAIEPAGWEAIHARGGSKHRLNRDEEKWQPRGIGVERSSAVGETPVPPVLRKKTSGKP